MCPIWWFTLIKEDTNMKLLMTQKISNILFLLLVWDIAKLGAMSLSKLFPHTFMGSLPNGEAYICGWIVLGSLAIQKMRTRESVATRPGEVFWFLAIFFTLDLLRTLMENFI